MPAVVVDHPFAMATWTPWEFIDYETSMITDEDPLRALLFY
jgi:hypothetical protein